MAAPESIDRHVTEALLTVAAAWGHVDRVILFEGSPFDAAARAEVSRDETVLLIGQTDEPVGLRGASRQRSTSALRYACIVMSGLPNGRKDYDQRIYALMDATAAIRDDLDDMRTALAAELTSAEADKLGGIEVQNPEVLVDPDANWGAREIPLLISLRRL